MFLSRNACCLFALVGVWLGTSDLALGQPTAEVQTAASGAIEAFQRGQAHYQAGQYELAIAQLQQAMTQFQQQGDATAAAVALSNLSLTYQQLGRWSAAERAIGQSLALLDIPADEEQVNRASEDAIATWIAVLDIQASLQFATGKTEAALASWEQTEAFANLQNDSLGVIKRRIQQAEALRVLGFYERARARLEAVAIDEPQTGGAEPQERVLLATQSRLLGNALRLSGNVDRAQTMLERSLSITTQLAPSPEREKLEGAVLLDLGNAARAEGRWQDALQHYEQAIVAHANPQFQAQVQIAQLDLLLDTEQPIKLQDDQALNGRTQQLRQELLTTVGALPTTQAGIYSRISLAQTLLQAKADAPALELLLQNTIALAMDLGDRRSLSYARGTLGTLYEQSGQLDRALALTQSALGEIQGLNAPDISYRWRWQIGRLQARRGDTAAAISAYEQAIANLDALRNDLVAVNREVQFSFRENVEPVYREAVALLMEEQPITEEQLVKEEQPVTEKQLSLSPADKAKNLEQARSYIEALQIAELDDYFREACLEGRSVALDQISQENPTTAVIYPIVLGDRLEVIVKIPGQPLQHHTTRLARAEVEKALDKLRQNLLDPRRTSEVQQQGKVIHQWLIQPVEEQLAAADINTLVFVLDGALRNIPMGVLFDGQRYLIEKYAVGTSLGLQLLDPKAIAQEKLNVLAMGLAEPPSAYSPPFSTLEFVESELEQIEATGIQGRQLLNQAFTQESLAAMVQRQDFNVVHIATHGQFSSDAEDTFILAADGEIGVAGLDQLLRERSQLDQRAIELLVLSACQTAEGDERAALGIAGVAVKAGARSTMASLWSVNDRSTSVLMGEFYAQLAAAQIKSGSNRVGTLTKAEMLRQAQLTLLQSNDFRRPYYWAPFILVGNWL